MNPNQILSALVDYRAAAALHENKTQLEAKVSLRIFFQFFFFFFFRIMCFLTPIQ